MRSQLYVSPKAIWCRMVLCVALLLCLSAAQAEEKKEPTREETLQWLTDKIEAHANFRYTREYKDGTRGENAEKFKVTNARVQDFILKCDFSYADYTKEGQIFNKGSGVVEFHCALADVDAAKVKVERSEVEPSSEGQKISGDRERWMVTIVTVNDRKVIRKLENSAHMHSGQTSSDTKESSFFLPFTDKEIAERVAKAFQHAVKLAKGSEAF